MENIKTWKVEYYGGIPSDRCIFREDYGRIGGDVCSNDENKTGACHYSHCPDREVSMFDFKDIPYSKYWLENVNYFTEWCFYEKRNMRKDSQSESNLAVDNSELFQQKYPTIEDAYKKFHRWMNSPR